MEEEKKTAASVIGVVPLARRKFPENCLTARGVRTQDYDMVLPAGTTIEDLLDPHLWAHLARKIRVDDTIHAMTETRDLWAHLWVVGITGKVVAVRVLQAKTFDVAPMPTLGETMGLSDGSEYPRIEWRGKQRKWCVIGIDREIIEGLQGFNSKEQAMPGLLQYKATLGLVAA